MEGYTWIGNYIKIFIGVGHIHYKSTKARIMNLQSNATEYKEEKYCDYLVEQEIRETVSEETVIVQ